jgi:hypothetical protein
MMRSFFLKYYIHRKNVTFEIKKSARTRFFVADVEPPMHVELISADGKAG